MSLLFAHPIGQAQSLLAGIDSSIGPIHSHEAVEEINQLYRAQGVGIPPTTVPVSSRSLVLAPPSSQGSPWARTLGNVSTAMASGWMRIRGTRRRRSLDRGFVVSNHADWPDLLRAIEQTGAEDGWSDPSPSRSAVSPGWKSTVAALFPSTRRSTRWSTLRAFADLYVALDETTKTNEKVAHLKHYLSAAAPADAAWAVNFLIGRRPKRLLESRKLVQWAIEETGVPEWMLAEMPARGGAILREVIALLLPPAGGGFVVGERGRFFRHEPAAALLGGGAPAPSARCRRRDSPGLADFGVAGNERTPALRLEQADHRRVSSRRFAESRSAGAGGSQRCIG